MVKLGVMGVGNPGVATPPMCGLLFADEDEGLDAEGNIGCPLEEAETGVGGRGTVA